MTTPDNIMNKLINIASHYADQSIIGIGWANEVIGGHKIEVRCSEVRTNSKTNKLKVWYIDDKRSSAAKVKALLDTLKFEVKHDAPKFKAVVSYIDFFDNALETKIVDVKSKCWKEACLVSGFISNDSKTKGWLFNHVSDDEEEAGKDFFDADMQIKVTWIE